LPRAALGTIPVRARQKVRLEQRLNDDLARLLDHPISDRRDPQRTLTTIGLRDLHPQHRLRSISLGLQVSSEFPKENLDTMALYILDAHAIDAGTSAVGSHFQPGPPQYIGPDDAVIQSVEPTAPTPLGRKIQSALEVS
jgi:hypothetical protein